MPTPATYSTNGMKLGKGRYVEVDEYGKVANFAWSKRYVTKTASYTVLRTESGTCFVSTGATADYVFTLPAISTGPWHFEFIAGADYNLTVTAGTADTMVAYNDLAADSLAFSTNSEQIGGRILVDCDGTTLFATGVGHNLQHQTVST